MLLLLERFFFFKSSIVIRATIHSTISEKTQQWEENIEPYNYSLTLEYY